MSGPSTTHTILYATGIVLSLLVWTIAAGLIDKYDEGFVYSGNFDAANAVLAWGLISWVYYIAALVVLLFVSSSNIFVSVIVDVTIMGFLWLFGIVSTGCLSDVANWFRWLAGEHIKSGSLGQATLAFAWLLVFLQLGTLLYEVIYTMRHYGGSMGTWRQSFHDLTGSFGGGSSSGGFGEKFGRRSGGRSGGTVPAVQTA